MFMDNNSGKSKPDGHFVLRKKNGDGHHIFSLRLRDEMIAQLDEIAARTSRSRNKVIVLLLEYALEHCIVEDDDD